MTSINNNPNPGLDLFLNLQPPGSEGDPFSKLATNIHGVPIGEKTDPTKTLTTLLGYSDKDTIGSALDEILSLATQLSTAFNKAQTSDDAVQAYFNTLDPTLPSLPPIRSLLLISERSLLEGKIGGVQVNSPPSDSNDPTNPSNPLYEKKANRPAKNSDLPPTGGPDEGPPQLESEYDDDIAPPSSGGGNPWLSGNVYVGFLIEFMEMQRMLMKNKVVEGKIELQSMNLITELAKSTADLIMDIAKTNRMIHITTAVMSAVAIGFTIGGLAYGGLAKAPGAFERGTAISGMGSQLEKLTTAAMQSATDITIAIKEGRKEVLAAYRQIAQHQMEKASEAFKASEDAIVQLLQALDKIRDALQQAVAASLRK